VRARLALGVLILGVVWAQVPTPDEGPPVRLAQQTVVVPPVPPSLPSIQPQIQAFTACVLNCDTAAGMCQGGCSVNNSPALLAATPPPGIRPDPTALSQCYLSCTNQQLVCKQTCTPPQ
jgi:hypothetical protein